MMNLNGQSPARLRIILRGVDVWIVLTLNPGNTIFALFHDNYRHVIFLHSTSLHESTDSIIYKEGD